MFLSFHAFSFRGIPRLRSQLERSKCEQASLLIVRVLGKAWQGNLIPPCIFWYHLIISVQSGAQIMRNLYSNSIKLQYVIQAFEEVHVVSHVSIAIKGRTKMTRSGSFCRLASACLRTNSGPASPWKRWIAAWIWTNWIWKLHHYLTDWFLDIGGSPIFPWGYKLIKRIQGELRV